MRFNTNIHPKHFEKNFIEIRKTSKHFVIGNLYSIVETYFEKDVPFNERAYNFITNAELVDKQTIKRHQLTNSVSNICYGTNTEIGLQILEYYGADEDTQYDILTFKNVGIC